jgi:hypothetical protein
VSGYRFHPEALLDLDTIWLYIAADSIDASEKVIDKILTAVAKVGSDLGAVAICQRFQLFDRLRAGTQAALRLGGDSWKAQSSRHCVSLEKQAINLSTVPAHLRTRLQPSLCG